MMQDNQYPLYMARYNNSQISIAISRYEKYRVIDS